MAEKELALYSYSASQIVYCLKIIIVSLVNVPFSFVKECARQTGK